MACGARRASSRTARAKWSTPAGASADRAAAHMHGIGRVREAEVPGRTSRAIRTRGPERRVSLSRRLAAEAVGTAVLRRGGIGIMRAARRRRPRARVLATPSDGRALVAYPPSVVYGATSTRTSRWRRPEGASGRRGRGLVRRSSPAAFVAVSRPVQFGEPLLAAATRERSGLPQAVASWSRHSAAA